MSLISCPECSGQISDKVKACPHCGYPFEEENRRSSPILHPVAVTCPQCGANLEIDEDAEKCFCMYCGSEIIFEKGGDGGADLKAIIKKFYNAALEALRANNMTEALANLEKVLKIDPDHYRAIMIKGVCTALDTELKSLKADTVISYFELSKTNFMQRKPSEKEIAEMELMQAENLFFTCKKIFEDAQETYISDGRKKLLSQYDNYWLGLDADTELAMYALERFKQREMILNNDIYAVYVKICDLMLDMCYEGYQKRWSVDAGLLIMRERDRLKERSDDTERLKKKAAAMRRMQQDIEESRRQKKYWEEHPEEYRQKQQALLDEQAEQLKIIEENKKKKFGAGARAREAAEAKLEKIRYQLRGL